jgi:hypothetical protein
VFTTGTKWRMLFWPVRLIERLASRRYSGHGVIFE